MVGFFFKTWLQSGIQIAPQATPSFPGIRLRLVQDGSDAVSPLSSPKSKEAGASSGLKTNTSGALPTLDSSSSTGNNSSSTSPKDKAAPLKVCCLLVRCTL